MELKKSLGLTSLIFYGVGSIVGAGIYSIIGAAAASAQEALWQSFLLASIVATLTGLSYAELASLFPKVGAEYLYLRQVIPKYKWLAFVTGFCIIVAAAATSTTVSIAFAGYFGLFFKSSPWIVVFLVLLSCSALNIIGIKESSWVNILFTLIEVFGLAVIIYFGTAEIDPEKILAAAPHPGVLSATAIIFFVYLGFNDIANLAEEAKDPVRTVPLAIVFSLIITALLYIAVGIAAVTLSTPEALGESRSPLSEVLKDHPFWAKSLAVIALFSTANTALISMIASSRVILSMTRDKSFPAVFGKIAPKRQTPWVAALLIFSLALAFLPFGKVEVIGELSSFTSLLAFVSVNCCLILHRKKHPEKKSPFHVPLSLASVPVLPVLAILSILILMTQFKPQVYVAGAGTIVLGLTLFSFSKKNNR